MTEWGVVGVIIALVGLIATIVPPLTKLTQSITKLTVVVDRLDAEQSADKSDCRADSSASLEVNEVVYCKEVAYV